MGRVKITREEWESRDANSKKNEKPSKARKLSPTISEHDSEDTDDTEATEIVKAKRSDDEGEETTPSILPASCTKTRGATPPMRKRLGFQEEDYSALQNTPGGFLTTGSGKSVSVSKAALRKAQDKIAGYSKEDDEAKKATTDENDILPAPGFLTSGSGKRINVSKSALKKAQQKLENYESAEGEPAGAKEPATKVEASSEFQEPPQALGILTTGSGKRVEVSKAALRKAQEKINSYDSQEKELPVEDKKKPPSPEHKETEETEQTPPAVIQRPKRQLHKPQATGRSPSSGVKFPKRAFRAPRKRDSQEETLHQGQINTPATPLASNRNKPSVEAKLKLLELPPCFPKKDPLHKSEEHPRRTTRCTDDICFPFSGDDVSLPVVAPYFLEYLLSVGVTLPVLGPFQYHYLLNKLGTNQEYTTLEWVSNHLRLICIKLSHMDHKYTPPTGLEKYLCPEVVLSQLVYRYNKEYVLGTRSTLYKLYNKDMTPAGRGLCLKVLGRTNKDNVLEVTDGWYTAKVSIDKLLQERVNLKVLTAGTKVVVYSPNLLLEHPVPPLEGIAKGEVLLHISFNSTRPAQEDTCLGLIKPDTQLSTRLANIHPEGGLVPNIAVVVQRCYPSTVTETIYDKNTKDKKYITRSLVAESIAAEQWRKKNEEEVAKMRAQIEMQLEKEHLGIHEEATKEEMENYRQEYEARYSEKLGTLPETQPRELQSRCEVLVSDSLSSQVTCILRLYNPPQALTDTLQEGYTVVLANCVPAKMQNRMGYAPMVLTGSGGRCHTRVVSKVPNHVFQKRVAVKLKDMPTLLKDKETFDFAGVVISTDAAAYNRLDKTHVQRHAMYLADATMGNLLLKVETQNTARNKEINLGVLTEGAMVGITDLTYIGKQHIVTHDNVNICVCHVMADEKACVRSNVANPPKHLQHLSVAASNSEIQELYKNKNLRATLRARVSSTPLSPVPSIPYVHNTNSTLTPQRASVGPVPFTPKSNPNKALFFSPPSNNKPQAFQPQTSHRSNSPPRGTSSAPSTYTPMPATVPSPAPSPAPVITPVLSVPTPVQSIHVMKAPSESVMHVFGHLTLPWEIVTMGKTATIKEGVPLPLLQDKAEVDLEGMTLKCMFEDGWAQRVPITFNLKCLTELLFPDSGVNEMGSTVLKKLISGSGDHADARGRVLTEYFAKKPFSTTLLVQKLLLCIFKGTIVPETHNADGVANNNLIPFTERDWKEYSTAFRSFSTAFVKATLSHRECTSVGKGGTYQSHSAPTWKVTRVFSLSDKVKARNLYN